MRHRIIRRRRPARLDHQVAGSENQSQASPDQSTAAAAATADSGKTASPNATATEVSPAADVATASSKTDESKVVGSATGTESNPAVAPQSPPAADIAATVNPPTDTAPASMAPAATARVPEPTPPVNAVPPPLPTPAVGNAAVPPPSTGISAAAVIPMPAGLSQGNAAGSGTAVAPGAATGSPIPPQAAMPTESVPLGRLVPSKSTVLLKFDAGAGQWGRVPSGEAVMSNEQLLVLPTYRPTIALSAGLTLQVPAETLLELKPPDARGISTVKLVYGRLVVLTAGKGGTQLGLELGGQSGVVSFVDADATLGVEVIRHFPAGANPETEQPEVTANLYGARGHLEWTPVGGTTTALGGMQMLSLNPTGGLVTATTLPNMPKWIEPEQLWPLDAQASDFLAQSLQDEKPLSVALREMVDHRKVENKSLGAQCLAMLDEFEPLVAAFGDSEQRPMWPVEIVSVKEALRAAPDRQRKFTRLA